MSMRALCILLLAWPALAQAAAALATVTIVDGGATLLRASTKLTLVEGMRLVPEDIVASGSARHVRVEFADGATLDLGPGTSVQVQPRLTGDATRKATRLYLLQGWVKVSAPANGATPPGPLLTSASLDVQAAGRGTVIAVEGGEAAAFAESGAATLAERRGATIAGVQRLKEGMFFVRSGQAAGEVLANPRSGFIQRVPRPFLDTLPPRAALFRDKEVASASAGALVYADVQPWIDAEPALRSGFVGRWRALARQGEFRKGLEQGLAAHPEWDRVLHPERYLPKPASSPASWPQKPPGPTRP